MWRALVGGVDLHRRGRGLCLGSQYEAATATDLRASLRAQKEKAQPPRIREPPKALSQYPDPRRKTAPTHPKQNGKRGRIAKSDAHNLWVRLKEHETAVLLFAKESYVAFTNNRAER